jgi:hypothetical protein
MIVSLLVAALFAAPVHAAQIAVPCPQDAMTLDWQSKTLVLWLTDGTNPDAAPRTATLKFKSCTRQTETLGEPMTPQDARYFVSDDGSIGVIATVSESDNAATWLTLVTRNGANGLTSSAQLGAFAHHRVYYRGVGFDQVRIQDWRDGGKTIVKNIFLIPEDAVIKP